MPDPILVPTRNIEDLANYAANTAATAFRARACKRDAFAAEVNKELDGGGSGHYTALTPEEEQFCLVWIYATEHEYVLPNGDVNDGKLISAIRRHLSEDGKLTTMSG